MAKKKEEHAEPIQFVESTLTKTEMFIENNQKLLTYIVGAIVIIILSFVLIKKYYIGAKEVEAQNQIWAAQRYFESDSLDLAMKGDGNYLGFNDIISQYKWTKSNNLARYYAGITYLKKGEYALAIENLKKFSSDSKIVSSMALGAIGDAYMELQDLTNAQKYYEKAATKEANVLTSPMFLMKAGFAYEEMKNYDGAIKMYEMVKHDYYTSMERRDIDKYIARAKTLKNS